MHESLISMSLLGTKEEMRLCTEVKLMIETCIHMGSFIENLLHQVFPVGMVCLSEVKLEGHHVIL